MSPEEPTADWFRGMVAMLARHFEPISLHEALQRSVAGELSGRTVSVTFDDGYADNFEVALPILREFDVPATFFVATGFLDGGRMWNDSIIETFRSLKDDGKAIELPNAPDAHLTDWNARRTSAKNTITAWKHLPPKQRQSCVDTLAARAGKLPDDLMMSSDQLRDMADTPGVTIGGHTRTHPILASQTLEESRVEIEGGKSDLEEIVQRELTLFAYPNGKHGQDFRDEHARLVEQAGFSAAVATDWGALSAESDRYRIPRFTPWHQNLARFSVDLARCHYDYL